jgi:hypothetical protein
MIVIMSFYWYICMFSTVCINLCICFSVVLSNGQFPETIPKVKSR